MFFEILFSGNDVSDDITEINSSSPIVQVESSSSSLFDLPPPPLMPGVPIIPPPPLIFPPEVENRPAPLGML